MVRVYRVRFGLWLGPGVRPKVTVKFGVRARVIRVTWGLGLGYNEGQLRGQMSGGQNVPEIALRALSAAAATSGVSCLPARRRRAQVNT